RLLECLKGPFVRLISTRLISGSEGEEAVPLERVGLGKSPRQENDLSKSQEVLGLVIEEASAPLVPLVGNLWRHATGQVTTQCCAMLQAVKGITATYRMTNKPPPERPSPFVTNILRPLREFDQRWKGCNAPSTGSGWREDVVANVAKRCEDNTCI
ncbi:unnamed protein product, partial [Choristocarpus tenellus]